MPINVGCINPTKIKGNYTHDDLDDHGGKAQTSEYASRYGYSMTIPIAAVTVSTVSPP